MAALDEDKENSVNANQSEIDNCEVDDKNINIVFESSITQAEFELIH